MFKSDPPDRFHNAEQSGSPGKSLSSTERSGLHGGINLADGYSDRKERRIWKDTAVMLEGEAVQSAAMLFREWNVTEYQQNCRITRRRNRISCHRELGFVIPYGDSPYDHEDVGKEVYFHILNHAKKYTYLVTPVSDPGQ